MQICDFSWVQHKPLETMTLNHFVPIRTKFYYFYPRKKKKKNMLGDWDEGKTLIFSAVISGIRTSHSFSTLIVCTYQIVIRTRANLLSPSAQGLNLGPYLGSNKDSLGSSWEHLVCRRQWSTMNDVRYMVGWDNSGSARSVWLSA